MSYSPFLPISNNDLAQRGWPAPDVILVTGDAYVDHPSYGAAVIGRVLEDAGFTVGIIAQPNWRSLDDFVKLGRPRFFFGVTAGNLDSMIANYTADKRPRKEDDYAPGGIPGLRPDRASIVYTNRLREAFPGVPIILGGLEASLRRLAHYDYWSDKVRRSLILDAKADILVYGMGEKQTMEIAQRLRAGEDIKAIDKVRGTAIVKNSIDTLKDYIVIPSFEEVSENKDRLNHSFKTIFLESDPFRGKTIVQKHGERFVVQLPPALPLATEEIDRIYSLNYARNWHPVYDSEGGVPGFETVRFSIISHRGCCGSCSFCSLFLHQGRIVQSRSEESIIEEAKRLSTSKGFAGTITDIGGPTANLYQAECRSWRGSGSCREKQCLIPEKCKNLKLGYEKEIRLWRRVRAIPKVKYVFISSGMRYDLLAEDYADDYLNELCAHHVSGQLKVATEHCVDSVLQLMNKSRFKVYEKFTHKFAEANKRQHKKQYLINYFISAHPGSRLENALELALYLAKRHIHPEQVQDYTPLPMTMSGCMYYTEKDPFTGKAVYVPKSVKERRMQRALIQYKNPKNKKYVISALRKLHKEGLLNFFYPRPYRHK